MDAPTKLLVTVFHFRIVFRSITLKEKSQLTQIQNSHVRFIQFRYEFDFRFSYRPLLSMKISHNSRILDGKLYSVTVISLLIYVFKDIAHIISTTHHV